MILNLMLGAKAGGLEQAAIDYAEALRLAGRDSITITPPGAWVNRALDEAGIRHQSLAQLGGWDPVASYRLRRIAKNTGAKAIICHGNRALKIAARALGGCMPIIVVAHNYQTRHFHRADACFCITEHARSHLMESGITKEKLFFMPNMVRLNQPTHRAYRSPPVFGTLARMVPKKGVEVYIEALAIVKSRGLKFHAVVGGDGALEAELRAQVTRLDLNKEIDFIGWVGDKHAFYASLDLFVLPSHHEAFGIVLIEAMAAGVPIISTDCVGPREIIREHRDGMVVPRGDATAMADAMSALLQNESLAQQFAASARERVEREYSMQAMAERLKSALAKLC
jgi:glycosyltransferase involved in cell wall biosynthesis